MGSTGAITERLTSQAQEKTLRKLIKQTANLKKEQYRIVDDDGNVIFKKQGKNDHVSMTVGEHRQYGDGTVSIHNHPQDDGALGGPFSENDLTDFGYGAKAIVVSAPEGEYRLTNLRFGKKDQTAGWIPLQNEIKKVDANHSTAKVLKESNRIMAESAINKELKATSDRWVKRREAGASKEELDAISAHYDELSKKYKAELHRVRRKLEIQPYHEVYKKYAKKYGFQYIYPKGAF